MTTLVLKSGVEIVVLQTPEEIIEAIHRPFIKVQEHRKEHSTWIRALEIAAVRSDV